MAAQPFGAAAERHLALRRKLFAWTKYKADSRPDSRLLRSNRPTMWVVLLNSAREMLVFWGYRR